MLDRALEVDSKHGLSLLARGRLYLGQENSSQAHSDFTPACWNKDPAIKARAHIGLGDILRRMSMRNWQAVEEYRMAISADPSCREAYYAIAETGFELRETSGYRLASEALARLICLDPDYRDAYDLWREKIRDQPPEELRKVGRCLDQYITHNPKKSYLWLDLARDRFALGEVEDALEALDKVKKGDPGYKAPERFLLRLMLIV